MGVVALEILEPVDGQTFQATADVRFRGRLVSAAPAPLFFKWYSSLAAGTPPGAPLNGVADNPLDFTRPLAVGSHVVTFTAKDVEGDTVSDLQSVQHGGLSGGPPVAPAPCVIHAFLANLVEPAVPGSILSKANATLAAQAPRSWGRQIQSSPAFEPDPDYHALNRIHFRWRFVPAGSPPGRPSADLIPALNQMTFDPGGAVPVVRYQGPLPGALGLGNYTLVLRVEDSADATIGHEVSRAVVLSA